MRTLPENSIRPFFPAEPVLPDQVGEVGQAEPQATGGDAGLHRAQAGQNSACADLGGPASGIAYAFYGRAVGYKFKRFNDEDDARRWAAASGLDFDGRLSERGLAVARSV